MKSVQDKYKQEESKMLAHVGQAAIGMHTHEMEVSDAQKYEKVLLELFMHGYEYAKEAMRRGLVKL